MDSENPADNVFVDFNAQSQSDLLGDPLATPCAIASFHLQNGVDYFLAGPFGRDGGFVWVKTAGDTFAL